MWIELKVKEINQTVSYNTSEIFSFYEKESGETKVTFVGHDDGFIIVAESYESIKQRLKHCWLNGEVNQ